MAKNKRNIYSPWLSCAALALWTVMASSSLRAAGSDNYGRVYYIDGAGNWGYGVSEVKEALALAGYKGRFINYKWSPTLNPALDQTVGRPVAKAKGASLGKEITKYLAKYPDSQVSIVALSAGTGVGVWACENVKPPAKVHSLVLLGSSISSNYDMTKALANIEGGVYVYHSPGDLICQGPVRTLGTIDGKLGVEPAGLVGLRPRSGSNSSRDKIVNIPWSPKYNQYGWTGAHTDATSVPFVRTFISKHILPPPVEKPVAKSEPQVTAAVFKEPPPPERAQPKAVAASQPH